MYNQKLLKKIQNRSADNSNIEALEAIIDLECITEALVNRNDHFALDFEIAEDDRINESFHENMEILKQRFEENGVHITRLTDYSFMIDWQD